MTNYDSHHEIAKYPSLDLYRIVSLSYNIHERL